MDEPVCLVPMVECHLDEVVAIESVSFSNPWKRCDFQLALSRPGSLCKVIKIGEQVIGYIVGFKIGREFHLADFAITPAYRRCGFGHQALGCLFADFTVDIHVVTLDVRMSNLAAISLYQALGFQTMAIHRAYYNHPEEDALVMVKTLCGSFSEWVLQASSCVAKTRESA